MDPADAADAISEAAEESKDVDERFRRRVAITIGVLAMLLALTGLGGDDAASAVVNSNIEASDTYAFYQAKNIRQTSNRLAGDEMEILLLSEPNLSSEARGAIERRRDSYRAQEARLESEPETGEGKRELLAKAEELVKQRARAQRQDPNFDYAQALFQIAIVLASVSIVATSRPLFAFSLLLGTVASLLMVNGFTLLVPLPFG
ncbi:MAG: DUF4337 domain-containing protein [Chloroflexota bacterium]|nr:DUF4337 domain-containing protein [Chloroflexota bacterium]